MGRPTDIRNRIGAPLPAATGETISLNKPAAKAGGEHKNTAPRPEMGGGGGPKPGKAQGGGGQGSVRPKV